jgi:5'-3' exonuclease
MQVNNLIIDGTNLEFRIFFISRNMKRTNTEGMQTGCIYRFLQTYNKLVTQFQPTNIYAAWDKKLEWPSTNFRKDILQNQYKAGRKKPDDIQEMFDQEVKLIEMLETLGVKTIYPKVLEADDVCAWLAKELPGNNVVVSADQDLLQLVDHRTAVYNLKELITYDNFEEKRGICPELFTLYKSIKGDQSDNIQGLRGHGEVRSKKLAKNWDNAKLTPEYQSIVERNLKLIDLHFGYEHQEGEKKSYQEQLNYVKGIEPDIEKFKALCEQYEFKTYIENINDWKRLINRNNIIDIINKL